MLLIILLQLFYFLTGIGILFIPNPVSYFFSFILVFSSFDSFMWRFCLKSIYETNTKDWRVIAYRIVQILVQFGYLYLCYYFSFSWSVGLSTVITWWLGFCDLCYYWMNLMPISIDMEEINTGLIEEKSEYCLPWMCGWSVHLIIRLIVEKSFTPRTYNINAHKDELKYNCPRGWFLWFAWIGFIIGSGINLIFTFFIKA